MKKLLSVLLAMTLFFFVCTTASVAMASQQECKISIVNIIKKYKRYHIFHSMSVVKRVNPTCVRNGYKLAQCKKCGFTRKTVLRATYRHRAVIDAAVAPTCLKSGLTEGTHCSVCKSVLKPQKTIKPLGHQAVTDGAVQPTCTKSGVTQGQHCSRCGQILQEQKEVPAGEHPVSAWKYEVLRTATPQNDGKMRIICGQCSEELYQMTVYKPKSIVLSTAVYQYTGEAIEPSVTVLDSSGIKIPDELYTVSYENNTEIGNARVIVSFNDTDTEFTQSENAMYSGELKAAFSVTAPPEVVTEEPTTKETVTEVEEPSTEAESGVVLITPAIMRVQCGNTKNSIGIYHTVSPGCKTYDVEYDENSSFRSSVVKRVITADNGMFGEATVTVDVASGAPREQKTYYVRIRAVDTANGKTTPWSTSRSVSIYTDGLMW